MQKHTKANLENQEMQGKLYRVYADAVEDYVKQPTVNNWEKKEKAFETYNALIESKRGVY